MAIPPQWVQCKYCGKDVPSSKMGGHMRIRHLEQLKEEVRKAEANIKERQI